MLALVRIHVPLTICDPRTGVTRQVTDTVWDHIVHNHASWHTDDIKPLYLTRRYLQEDTSLIVDARDSDALAEFLTRNIAPIENVGGIWVVNMARVRLYKTPKERHSDLSRFTVTLNVVPRHMDQVYDAIASLGHGRDVIIVYLAHTFQSPKASIVISVLARSANHLEAFVKEYIEPLEGVISAEVNYISKTLRLASPKEWKECLGPCFIDQSGEAIRDIDVEDDSLMAGC